MSSSTTVNAEEEPAELLRFREQWREEVRRRREEQQAQQQAGAADHQTQKASLPENPSQSPSANRTTSPIRSTRTAVLDGESRPSPLWSIGGVPPESVYTSHGHTQLSRPLARAVEIYRSAVQHEQESDLDEALRLYRQAFRLDPHVDRAYFKEEERLQQSARTNAGVSHRKTASTGKVDGVEGGKAYVTRVEPKDKPPTSGILSKLLAEFPEAVSFDPEDEREGVPINIIPEEVLLHVLRTLDTTTLERFAAVSRKARVLSLDSSIWRDFVHLAYKPPQISEAETAETIAERYNTNYRQTYIEHPRLRLDGVYIAVCHYVRRGLSENAWVNISHLITYHRYLRFFPDGQVLSLLANEEYQPSLVIPMLKPSLRMKGFYIGEWRLDGSTVLISNLVEMHSSTHQPSTHPSHHHHIPQPTRYHFQMTLGLRSRPLGRWNKLDLVSYESVSVEDGEVVPLPLKHERPFWFSKVKSWPGY
ncbi:hypothetical protein HYDPIDRAFT_88327 [Hydnomerulius pinastri MD-312]|nr:hypothetical protein HYDPIDRAFT_88327 [Hydnomerulius pinastri MD-312]